MKQLLAFLFLVSSFMVHAKETKIAVITSEFDRDVMDFYIITDSNNNIDSIHYVQTTPSGAIFSDVTVPAEEVIESGGVVIVERQGRDAVILKVEQFSTKTGGIVVLNYLHNGVTGTRHVKRTKLKNTQGQLLYTDMNNNPINRLFLTVNSNRVLGIIGIKDILMSYSQDTSIL